jgi:hypothetical protein
LISLWRGNGNALKAFLHNIRCRSTNNNHTITSSIRVTRVE